VIAGIRPEIRLNRPVFLINFKNYREILGEGAMRLAADAQLAAEGLDIELIIAPPVPSLSAVAAVSRLRVFSQSVGNQNEGKSTGAIIPEALKASGCSGSIVNHSESRLSPETIRVLVPRMKGLGLSSCVCGEDTGEIVSLAALDPEYLAVEPPELIGSGIAVSNARPELLRETVKSARGAGYSGKLLCGAGIVSGDDASAAMRLGMDGVLVASSVVKSKDWGAKVRELATALM
jgi:triosephosphate isomerase